MAGWDSAGLDDGAFAGSITLQKAALLKAGIGTSGAWVSGAEPAIGETGDAAGVSGVEGDAGAGVDGATGAGAVLCGALGAGVGALLFAEE